MASASDHTHFLISQFRKYIKVTVRQDGSDEQAELIVVTHSAMDSALSATVADLRKLDTVRSVETVIRVEGGAN